MAERRIAGFFYGLFMDPEVLRDSDVAAENPRRACVEDFALRIGRRATLLPSEGAKAYGMVYAMTYNDLERLYGAPGLEDYRPEAVTAQLLAGGSLPALCYNLKDVPSPDEADAAYAERLREALIGLGFPEDYAMSVG